MFLTFKLVHLNILTAQKSYHAQLPRDYFESLGYFIHQEYEQIILGDYPARTVQETYLQSENMS